MGVEALVNFTNLDVAVLLTTYNGEKYIDEQINSILRQKNVKVKIYVHDDFSQDNTLELVKKLQNEYPEQIFILESKNNLGVIRSYQFLLDNVKADYYFFSDQDDVWHEDKVAEELKLLLNQNINIPALVYSDLEIVDANLNMLSSSMFKKMNVKSTDKTAMLLVQNVITGNTVAFNSALRNFIIRDFRMEDDRILMHDGWLGLVASIYGKLLFLDEPMVKYRQHGNNVVGANKKKIFALFNIKKLKYGVIKTILQSQALENKIIKSDNDLLTEDKKIVKIYADIISIPRIMRLNYCLRIPLRKQGLLRNILFLLFILTIKDEVQ